MAFDPKEVRERVHRLRGEILQEQITCEQLITLILDSYYGQKSNPDHIKVHRDLIITLSFNRKIQLLINILKEYGFPKPKITEIKKGLEYIQAIRNGIAHQQWHSMNEDEIIFGLNEKKIKLNTTFTEEFKKRVQKTEAPLMTFYFKEFDPD